MSKVVYSYTPSCWDEEVWLASGGFVAVVLGYKHVNCIERAISSAFNQDFQTFEVFLMDDCSGDGTLEKMVECTKKFSENNDRPIRVSVVGNEVNRSACGQWHTARHLSKGTWFGMFCGDDESLPDRISIVKGLIDKYPLAYGVSTNYRCVGGSSDGKVSNDIFYEERTWAGTDSTIPLVYTYGCATFWHKDLLEAEFKKENIDDFIVLWRLFSLRQGTKGVAMVWAMDKVTVNYSTNTGVSHGKESGSKNWIVKTWQNANAFRYWTKLYGCRLWSNILEFDKKYGHDGYVREQIKGFYLKSQCVDRMNYAALFKFLVAERNNDFGGARKTIMYEITHHMVRYVFGNFSFLCIAAMQEFCKLFRKRK